MPVKGEFPKPAKEFHPNIPCFDQSRRFLALFIEPGPKQVVGELAIDLCGLNHTSKDPFFTNFYYFGGTYMCARGNCFADWFCGPGR